MVWIERLQAKQLKQRLQQFAAVVLLGPREVGKTTLARHLGQTLNALYLDLESPSDLARLSDPELYLVIEWPTGERWAVAIKRSSSTKLSRGFHEARADVKPTRCFVVAPITSSYPLAEGVEAISLPELAYLLNGESVH